MIDTIRLKIPLNSQALDAIKEYPGSKVFQRYNYRKEIINTYRNTFTLEKYKDWLSPYVEDHLLSGVMYLEFSVPKLVFGQNINLFYPQDLKQVLFDIQLGIEKKFGVEIPSFQEWIVQRLDVCYVWKFATNTLAHDALVSLQAFEYPRKRTAVYDTSITHFGNNFTVKFYLKHDEFLDKNYAWLYKLLPHKADQLKELSEGVLRFEVEYKKKKLDSYFQKKDLTVDDVCDQKVLERILNEELGKLLKGMNTTFMDKRQVAEKLLKTYKTSQAFHYHNFYLAYCNRREKTLLKGMFGKSLINRYLKKLSDAGVGILSKEKAMDVSLTIPSTMVINQANDQVALATDHVAESITQTSLFPPNRRAYE